MSSWIQSGIIAQHESLQLTPTPLSLHPLVQTPSHLNRFFRWVIIALMALDMCACDAQQPQSIAPILDSSEEANIGHNTPPFSPFFEGEPMSEVVRTMLQDRQGRFWFGTQDGVFVYDGKQLQWLEEVNKETIKDIAEDLDGNIWLAHTNGIYKIKGEEVTHFGQADGLLSEDTWCIVSDAQNTIWIGTFDGLFKFDGKEFTLIPLPEGQKNPSLAISGKHMIIDLLVDFENQLWISSTAGLFRYNGQEIEDISASLMIPKQFVSTLYEDPQGVLWAGSNQGLFRIENEKATNFTKGIFPMDKGIGAVARDAQGRLWMVVNQHQWVTYDGERFNSIAKDSLGSKPVVFQWYLDQSMRWWMVGYGGAFRMEESGHLQPVTKTGPW